MRLDDTPSFFTAPCTTCGHTTLCARALHHDTLRWCCLSCDTPVVEAEGQWVEAAALHALGYTTPTLDPPARHGDEAGGCRGGQCGVRQR